MKADFSIHNIPFGIFSVEGQPKRVATILEDQVWDLYALAKSGLFKDLEFDLAVFEQPFLNPFIALGKAKTGAVRTRLQDFLSQVQPFEMNCSFDVGAVSLHLPVQIGDYTDFYSSEVHAINVGKMFRNPDQALYPNWKHMPIAYHGRASSICVSGTPLHRPKGQIVPKGSEIPVFSYSHALDFEVEMAAIIGKDSAVGQPVSCNAAADYVFGFALFNDWSARDIQRWEYVPLGPFLSKNFFSSLSPWVVTLEALAPFRVEGLPQVPSPLPYLQGDEPMRFDIHLEVSLQPEGGQETVLTRTNYRHVYWNLAQKIAHHTITGCNLRVGDVLASGTISAPDGFGTLLELTWGGETPIVLPNGQQRRFVEDWDTIRMQGYAEKDGVRVGFGCLENKVLPAL